MIWAGQESQHVDQLRVAGSGPFTFTTPLHLRRLYLARAARKLLFLGSRSGHGTWRKINDIIFFISRTCLQWLEKLICHQNFQTSILVMCVMKAWGLCKATARIYKELVV
ncbi:unnamed protein product [Arabidopsis lyrata]|nr:unnamed protein product [Arabidopsis lyrata]